MGWLDTCGGAAKGASVIGAGASNSSGTYTSPKAFCNTHECIVIVIYCLLINGVAQTFMCLCGHLGSDVVDGKPFDA